MNLYTFRPTSRKYREDRKMNSNKHIVVIPDICHKYHKLDMWRKICHVEKFQIYMHDRCGEIWNFSTTWCLFCYYLFMALQCKSNFNRYIHVGVPVGQSWIKQNQIFSTSFCYSTNFPTPNPFNWSPNQSTGPQIHWMCFGVTKSPNWTK